MKDRKEKKEEAELGKSTKWPLLPISVHRGFIKKGSGKKEKVRPRVSVNRRGRKGGDPEKERKRGVTKTLGGEDVLPVSPKKVTSPKGTGRLRGP